MGTLFLVATPIGNLEDITARAVRILREAQLIAAEDTRITARLLAHYNIQTRQISYFEHNKISRLKEMLAALADGDVALVSDAGTPGLNDPGYELVRAAVEAGFAVSPVPGPASPIAAIVASGLPTDSFLYLGYLPRKAAERRAEIARVSELPYTLIFLETPHRLSDSLADLEAILGDRPMAIARELTKIHEEIWRGAISAARQHFQKPRGELVLVIGGRRKDARLKWSQLEVRKELRLRLKRGIAPTAAAADLAAQSGWARREIYNLATRLGSITRESRPRSPERSTHTL